MYWIAPSYLHQLDCWGFLNCTEGPAKKRITEELIIRILQEGEQAENLGELCRRHTLPEQTLYRWRNKYGGMDVSEEKRLRELKNENAELKKVVAEQMLDIRMLKDVNSKKW